MEAGHEDAGTGGEQVPQPAQHRGVGAKYSQHNHATVLVKTLSNKNIYIINTILVQFPLFGSNLVILLLQNGIE